MSNEEKILRRLVIKTFHINDVRFGEKFSIDKQILTISLGMLDKIITNEELIKDIQVEIIPPGEHDRWTNSIMDIIPISTKVLGKLGEGITHTLTGVYVMLTGVDEAGNQVAEFGSSEGNLKDKLYLNRAGTPSDQDFIISFNVTLKEKAGYSRPGPAAAHRACDIFIQQIRNELKKVDGRGCTEKHVFYDKIRPGKKKVAIVKQIAGQGAMHDNLILPNEPSGFQGGRSIIDLGNVPIILTPNEYRDGALRAMT
ncbi:proline reductase cluster protein PrdD [Anoxybacter fermentans]|uniref:Proline reductase cluster protein PrdD n=1 Tax=Anoxybacter fermentans TaxID=1323375 RepID=A0A3S9T275_9FIRM|nr:proline reductase cluster protein PrdD [Anoxybacter fermentans]AZR74636.1 proline reductase cluster protein PrdD [Anoxybacter fermentans]